MAFPFTIRYSKTFNRKLDDSDVDTIIDYINDYAIQKKADTIFRSDNKLTIRSWIIGWNWRAFSQIDKGEFSVVEYY